MEAKGWQGNRNGQSKSNPDSVSDPAGQYPVSVALEALHKEQAKISATLRQAIKRFNEIEEKLSKFGIPRQLNLPVVAYAIQYQRYQILRHHEVKK